MAKSLDECMGLLAFYEAETLDGMSINELSKFRKQVYKDFKKSKIDNDIDYLLWSLLSYPAFLEKAIMGRQNAFENVPEKLANIEDIIGDEIESLDKNKLNKLLDKTVIANADNKIIKKYLKTKLRGKHIDTEDYIAQNDSEEVILFLINFENEYENRILSSFKN